MRNIFEAAIKANGVVKGIMIETKTMEERREIIRSMDEAIKKMGTCVDTFQLVDKSYIETEHNISDQVCQFVQGQKTKSFEEHQILVIEGSVKDHVFSSKFFHPMDRTKVNNKNMSGCLTLVYEIINSISLAEEEKSLLLHSLDIRPDFIQNIKQTKI
jgi:hypothetical protein